MDAEIAEIALVGSSVTSSALMEREIADDAAEKQVGTTRPTLARVADFVLRPWAYWIFHSNRLFGWAAAVPPLIFLRPKETILAMATYCVVHRRDWWQRTVHKCLGYGASRRHKIVNPSSHLIKDDRRYLFCLHPHGLLADGWHSLIARDTPAFDDAGKGPQGIGRKLALCFAPVIQHVPVHQEMYRGKCGGADRKSIVKWWNTTDTDPALIPGGFPESVFANAGEKQYEYSYLKDRKGFIRICLEEGKDIVPCYTFRLNRMYHSSSLIRGKRARMSQQYHIGFVPFSGWMGTSMPLTDKTTTVVFPPFEVTGYELSQLDECHAAYLDHLKKYFDMYKSQYGMKGVEMVFIGNDFEDTDPLAKALVNFGIMSKPRPKHTQGMLPKDKAKRRPSVVTQHVERPVLNQSRMTQHDDPQTMSAFLSLGAH